MDNFILFDEVSFIFFIIVIYKLEEDIFGVFIVVGFVVFVCVLLVVFFVMINKYG